MRNENPDVKKNEAVTVARGRSAGNLGNRDEGIDADVGHDDRSPKLKIF